VSQYPPGWALVLTPAAALGLPLWIANPLIGAATVAAFFELARRSTSEESAWLGALLLMLSSFFIFQSASYFAHSLVALFAILFALFGLRFLERGGAAPALLAGACIGVIGFTRPQAAALTALSFVAALAARPSRRFGLIWFGLGGAPFALALLLYNAAITGDPLVLVQSLRANEPLGSPPFEALSLWLRRCGRLVLWTAPPLVFGYVAAFAVVARRRSLAFTDWIMPATLGFYLFYAADGGNQYGRIICSRRGRSLCSPSLRRSILFCLRSRTDRGGAGLPQSSSRVSFFRSPTFPPALFASIRSSSNDRMCTDRRKARRVERRSC